MIIEEKILFSGSDDLTIALWVDLNFYKKNNNK